MEDNENVVSSTETEQSESTAQTEEKKGKTYSRDDVNKMINAEKDKLRKELEDEFKAQKTEAEKLAKMDAEEKLKYELEQTKKELESVRTQNNSLTLKSEATSYAESKGLPLSYIEDLDFAREDANSVKTKIDKLVKVRNEDMEKYLKDKLKQPSPKAIDESKGKNDPFTKGYEDYMKKYRK